MTLKISLSNIQDSAITAITALSGPKVSSITYPSDDTAADTAGGQTITLTGSGFGAGASVLIGSTAATVVTVVTSTQITFTSPAQSAGTYVVYVVNTDGGTAISIPGLSYSGTPVWSTTAGSLGGAYESAAINSTVTATGDAPVTYSLYSGTLPTGSSFNTSTGVLSGTAPASTGATTYSFVIRATDAQNQDTNRSFSITINTDVVTWSSPAAGSNNELALSTVMTPVTLVATSAAGQTISYSANALPTGVSIVGANITGTPTDSGTTSSLITATAAVTNRTATRTLSWTVSIASDPYFMYTPLLLAGNGTNGIQNNTILDSSTNNYAITRAGNTTQGTFTPFGPNWSNYFDGTADFLQFSNNSAFLFGSGDFTLECWLFSNTVTSGDQVLMSIWDDSSTVPQAWDFRVNGSGKVFFQIDVATADTTIFTSVATLSAGQWYHLAVTRSGNTFRLFINGTLDSTTTNGSTISNGNGPLCVGGYTGSNQTDKESVNGYLSNVRIVKGTAVYTGNFTPSTTPLTAITNTSLLTCQSNRFIDNSTNAFAITKNGDVSVQRFSPFGLSAAYTAGTIGGSMSLLASNLEFSRDSVQLGTGDLTIECWVYPFTFNTDFYIFNRAWNGANFFMLGITTTAQLDVWFGHPSTGWFTAASTSTPFKTNQWHHVALTRSGTSVKAFVNGVAVVTGTSSVNLTNGDTSPCYIGKYWFYPNALANGYVSNFRVVAGTAVYTIDFTPPTAPLTAISGTTLLLSATNAGISDSTIMNNMVTVGNAQISTAQSKFGGSSISLDGTGDYLSSVDNLTLAFGLSAFTVEGWIYLNNTSGTKGIVFGRGNNSFGLRIGQSYNGNVNGLNIAKSGIGDLDYCAFTFVTNTWYHIAVVRSGTTIYFFVNGTQQTTQGSGAGSFSFVNPTSGFYIGCNNDTNEQFAGYIDDFRITKGYARYTSNFTAPTELQTR